MRTPLPTSRYSAFLLFQYRVETNGRSNHRRWCEKRLILFEARGARAALRHAKRRGRESEHSYQNGYAGIVHFEFVGVQDLLQLGLECESDEVWYEMIQMVRPMERREQLIPSVTRLPAILHERSAGRGQE